ncbi:uncharacterized protein LOC134856698 [Symsagittifera roscoffensis]|uniref:uncharacterized protein LOC134856698 n=1 Tax=Symsagittifera roscoffensis TaxID=84072 RepID=UPI00307B5B35
MSEAPLPRPRKRFDLVGVRGGTSKFIIYGLSAVGVFAMGNLFQPFVSEKCRKKWHRMYPTSLANFYKFNEYLIENKILRINLKDRDFVSWNVSQKERDWYNNFLKL